jgi:hypothetical protein
VAHAARPTPWVMVMNAKAILVEVSWLDISNPTGGYLVCSANSLSQSVRACTWPDRTVGGDAEASRLKAWDTRLRIGRT